jgi:hypothetical protein
MRTLQELSRRRGQGQPQSTGSLARQCGSVAVWDICVLGHCDTVTVTVTVTDQEFGKAAKRD